jgi:hypothetical protein
MSKLTESQINEYLDKLLQFAESLPIGENGTVYIKGKLIVDFLDTWQFDDEANDFSIDDYLSDPKNANYIDVKTTYGIWNTSQINRYINNFISSLKKSRIKALDKRLKELDQLHPAQKAARLSKSLAAINRTELFAKYGLEKIKDPEWNTQIKEILGAEISFAKDQAAILTKAPDPFKLQAINQDDILIVEELENRIALEAVEYRRECDDNWENIKFDPTYFDTFISVTLLNEFVKSLYDRIRPLNNQEINRYLSLSLQQFKTHTPPKRHKAFLLNYFHTYWFPNAMEYKNEEYMDKYATHVWKHYANHFSIFKEATAKIYSDFKAGLIGVAENEKASLIPYNIKEEYFNSLLKSLGNCYPYSDNPLIFHSQWEETLLFFKKEVLGNLIHLDQTPITSYLNSLKFEFEELHKSCYTDQQQLDEIYLKYDTNETDILSCRLIDHPLHNMLVVFASEWRDNYENPYYKEVENVQRIFYNFHYGKIVKDALDFLTQKEIEYAVNDFKDNPPATD